MAVSADLQIDLLSHPINHAQRLVLGQGMPRIEGQILAEAIPLVRDDALAWDNDLGDGL